MAIPGNKQGHTSQKTCKVKQTQDRKGPAKQAELGLLQPVQFYLY